MEEVERINEVIVCSNQRAEFVQCNIYAMDIDRGRNCYSCGGFDHLVQNCRRQIIDQEMRMEYKDHHNNG